MKHDVTYIVLVEIFWGVLGNRLEESPLTLAQKQFPMICHTVLSSILKLWLPFSISPCIVAYYSHYKS